jgi:hypothetical protein
MTYYLQKQLLQNEPELPRQLYGSTCAGLTVKRKAASIGAARGLRRFSASPGAAVLQLRHGDALKSIVTGAESAQAG